MTALHSQSIADANFQELCDVITTTQVLLQYSFHGATVAQRSLLESKLDGLQNTIKLHQIFSSFQKSLQQVDKSWVPKGRIEQVVSACCNLRYEKHDIERTFYEHGGINGLLVLHLGTRFQNALLAQLYALPVELREELAEQCRAEEINPAVQAWIDNYDKSQSTDFSLLYIALLSLLTHTGGSDPEKPPPRLDRFAKDRESRVPPQSASSNGKLFGMLLPAMRCKLFSPRRPANLSVDVTSTVLQRAREALGGSVDMNAMETDAEETAYHRPCNATIRVRTNY